MFLLLFFYIKITVITILWGGGGGGGGGEGAEHNLHEVVVAVTFFKIFIFFCLFNYTHLQEMIFRIRLIKHCNIMNVV